MSKKNNLKNTNQVIFDFEKVRWPDNELFPLNLKDQKRSVQTIVYNDVNGNIINYYSYIEELVELFYKKGFPKHANHLYTRTKKSSEIINSSEHFNTEKLKHVCSTFIQI